LKHNQVLDAVLCAARGARGSGSDARRRDWAVGVAKTPQSVGDWPAGYIQHVPATRTLNKSGLVREYRSFKKPSFDRCRRFIWSGFISFYNIHFWDSSKALIFTNS